MDSTLCFPTHDNAFPQKVQLILFDLIQFVKQIKLKNVSLVLKTLNQELPRKP